jgi:hypothetical protein
MHILYIAVGGFNMGGVREAKCNSQLARLPLVALAANY